MKHVPFLLIILLIGLLSVPNLYAKEREFGTYLALGYGIAAGSSEGLSTPVIFMDHESKDYFANGTFRFKYQTVSPTISMTHRFQEILDFEYAVYGTAISEGSGSDFYENGVHQKNWVFAGDGISKMLGLHLMPYKQLRLSLILDSRDRKFYASSHADENQTYDLPDPFTENTNKGILKWVGLLDEDGTFSVEYISGKRSSYLNWELETDYQTKLEFTKNIIVYQDSLKWTEENTSKIKLTSANGENVDLFSGFRVGGNMSEYGVTGHFRNEYRAENISIMKFSQEIKFAKDRILTFYADQASFKTQTNSNINSTGESMSISGIGIGFHYGIRSLKGLPIIINYGRGLNVPDSSKEKTRQELILILAAAF